MKTIKIFTLLVLFSLQAGATGYSHNMFVAHKKLQAGKECVQKVAGQKSKTLKKHVVSVRQAPVSFTSQFTNKMAEEITLNERVLEEGPGTFFQGKKDDDSQNSVVSKLVSIVRNVVYAFIGSPKLGNS